MVRPNNSKERMGEVKRGRAHEGKGAKDDRMEDKEEKEKGRVTEGCDSGEQPNGEGWGASVKSAACSWSSNNEAAACNLPSRWWSGSTPGDERPAAAGWALAGGRCAQCCRRWTTPLDSSCMVVAGRGK